MRTAPGLSQWIPLPVGPLWKLQNNLAQFQLQLREQFGDVVRFRSGPLTIHFLYHPNHVKRVLQDRQKYYRRGWQYRMLGRLVGNGMIVTDGEYWLRQRRLTQPAFHRQRLSRYVEMMADVVSENCSRWESLNGQSLDLRSEMSRVTLGIICRTMFGRMIGDEAQVVREAFATLQKYLEHRLHHPFSSLPLWIPTQRNREFREAMRAMDQIVYSIIDERRRSGNDEGDLLSILLHARDEQTGESMTDQQLRDEVLTFFVAGHETTAIALTWTWFLLASNPEWMERVNDELTAVLGDRRPTIDDLLRLEMQTMVIEESMRLYPPVHTIVRSPTEDDEIDGYRIPVGTNVIVSQFVTHRHPDFWEEPDKFDPLRFTAEKSAQRPRYAYFPFIGGPHQCIGAEFAMIEARLVISMMLQRFRLGLISGQTVEFQSSLGLIPKDSIRVQLELRATSPIAAS